MWEQHELEDLAHAVDGVIASHWYSKDPGHCAITVPESKLPGLANRLFPTFVIVSMGEPFLFKSQGMKEPEITIRCRIRGEVPEEW